MNYSLLCYWGHPIYLSQCDPVRTGRRTRYKETSATIYILKWNSIPYVSSPNSEKFLKPFQIGCHFSFKLRRTPVTDKHTVEKNCRNKFEKRTSELTTVVRNKTDIVKLILPTWDERGYLHLPDGITRFETYRTQLKDANIRNNLFRGT